MEITREVFIPNIIRACFIAICNLVKKYEFHKNSNECIKLNDYKIKRKDHGVTVNLIHYSDLYIRIYKKYKKIAVIKLKDDGSYKNIVGYLSEHENDVLIIYNLLRSFYESIQLDKRKREEKLLKLHKQIMACRLM